MNGQEQGQGQGWPPGAGQPQTPQQPQQPQQPMQQPPPQAQQPQAPAGWPGAVAQPGAVPVDPTAPVGAGAVPGPPWPQTAMGIGSPQVAGQMPGQMPPPVAPGGMEALQQAAAAAGMAPAPGGAPVAGDQQAVVDGFGVDQRGKLVRLPDNYQPVSVGVVSLKPSSRAGVPELELIVRINDGPFLGLELARNDSRVFYTLPNIAGAKPQDQGRLAGFARQKLGNWNAFCVALSGQGGNPGQTCDGQALATFGFQTSPDPQRAAAEIADQFGRLDPATKCEFIKAFLRVEQWNDKNVMAYIRLRTEDVTQENPQTGQREKVMVVDPATQQAVQQTRQRNELTNVFPWNDARYGHATWQRSYLPALEQQHAAMVAQGLL